MSNSIWCWPDGGFRNLRGELAKFRNPQANLNGRSALQQCNAARFSIRLSYDATAMIRTLNSRAAPNCRPTKLPAFFIACGGPCDPTS